MLYLQIFTKQLEPPLILQVAKRESSNCADEEQNGSTARAKIRDLGPNSDTEKYQQTRQKPVYFHLRTAI